jgi:hypothetical protein
MVEPETAVSVRKQCELLSVSRSGLYYEPVPTSAEELDLMRRIDELHLKAVGAIKAWPSLIRSRARGAPSPRGGNEFVAVGGLPPGEPPPGRILIGELVQGVAERDLGTRLPQTLHSGARHGEFRGDGQGNDVLTAILNGVSQRTIRAPVPLEDPFCLLALVLEEHHRGVLLEYL